ncbi:MAG: hypothetical protein MUE42_09900 [Opitutaceae bacterium]|jgi:hypothetical protein|nr:hypothetical protein [Opitutaceae bacterium]
MKIRIAISLGLVVLGIGAWRLTSRQPEPSSAAPVATMAPVAEATATDDPRLKLQADHAEVFQRAFWRRAAPEDRILHAERRHLLAEPQGGVERWQWFIVVEPGQAFADWLFNENPFDLAPVAPGLSSLLPDNAPEWMPGAAELSGYAHYHKPGGSMHVFRDPRTRRIYATDQGGGFADPSGLGGERARP